MTKKVYENEQLTSHPEETALFLPLSETSAGYVKSRTRFTARMSPSVGCSSLIEFQIRLFFSSKLLIVSTLRYS